MSNFTPRIIEASGKSVDEAIYKGLTELGIAIDEVDIEIVQQATKGVFGIGSKPCVVKLTERDIRAMLEDESEASRPSERHRDQQERAPRPQSDSRPRSRQRGGKPRQSGPKKSESLQPAIAYEPYERGNGNDAADFLIGLLENMKIPATIFVAEDDGVLKIKVISDAMGILIGHRGETLDALQYITSLVINRGKEDYQRISIDTENYRSKREDTLSRLARKMASQVRASGNSITLEPMNPYERRVIHSSLQNHPHVTTHSVGEEPSRSVVIEPK